MGTSLESVAQELDKEQCDRLNAITAVVVVTEALTDETIHDAVKMWCKGGSDREAMVARFGEIGDWNVSAVTSMKELFAFQKDFNEDISRWDTSNVTMMYGMFRGARSFNQPVEGWNTAHVRTMSYMFRWASSFNQSVEGWNIANDTRMFAMFEDASSFTQQPSWLR